MRAIAEMVQRNPSLLLVLLVGLPSLTWAAAYARRPSRARRRVAVVALAATWLVALVATFGAARAGSPWWPPLVCATVIAIVWTVAIAAARGKR